MFIIRPIKDADLESLMELLKTSGHGLTSLPKDRDIIADKISESELSFQIRRNRPRGESYLFVMEELFTGKIVGVSGIISKIGGFEAFYFYKLQREILKSEMLAAQKELKTHHIEKVHSGPTEICSLFLDPKYRNAQNGRFLSLSRFLYIAENEEFFENEIIAEMRGKVDDNGESPFWNAVGRKFMDIDFVHADLLTLKSKKFIDELVPKYPIIANLLPQDAQDVIAEVHPATAPARRILEQEGFSFKGLVGIFEPGPVLEAKLPEVRTYKDSRVVEIGEVSSTEMTGETYIISTSSEPTRFRATLGQVMIGEDSKAKISAVSATALKIRVGEKIRFISLKG